MDTLEKAREMRSIFDHLIDAAESARSVEQELGEATKKTKELEARVQELESEAMGVLPPGVDALRDGSYETDEKIRLFKRRIAGVSLASLEKMFDDRPAAVALMALEHA